MLSGCAAEVAAGTLFTPMEVMKNRLQTRHDLQYSALKLAKTIMRTEGFRGFYRGYWMGLAVFVPHTMTYFVCYEKLKEWVTPHALPFQTYMFSSSIAGVISILVSTPLDIVKTRWQISADEHGKAYRKGPLVIGKELILKEGKGALTRGLWARIAWGIPTTAISMTVFELLKDGNA
jgi:hypothetical protein